MTRIHITASGKAAPCTATLRDCPRGVSNHFETMKEAVVAIRRLEAAAPLTLPTDEPGTPSYTEAEVYELAVDELRKAGLLSEGWTVAFGQRVRALGTCYHTKKQIEFSKLWFPIMSRAEARDTVVHEVAHAMVGPGQEHNEVWQAQHRALGGNGLATYDNADPDVRAASNERFRRFYPNGVQFGTRGGVAKRELDPEMIEALKLKFLKKFKMPFDESGLSIPDLLQMAQKGELD